MIIRPALRRLALVALAAVAAGPGVALASRDVPLASRGAGSPVTIGLFVPVRGPQAALGTDVLRGAEIAVAQARREDGGRGRPLRLVTAPSDLRWEASTGALVRLLYEEGAVAVVGALDGRSAHLAERHHAVTGPGGLRDVLGQRVNADKVAGLSTSRRATAAERSAGENPQMRTIRPSGQPLTP